MANLPTHTTALTANEDKALTADTVAGVTVDAPATNTDPVEATDADLVDVTLAHYFQEYRPGQTIQVSRTMAASLEQAGYVVRGS